MSKKKLLEKLQQFFNADQQEKANQREEIQKILKKLKEKERKIQHKLEICSDTDKVLELSKELDIIYAQRMKGVKIVKQMAK